MAGQNGGGITRNSGNYGDTSSFRNTADAERMVAEAANIN